VVDDQEEAYADRFLIAYHDIDDRFVDTALYQVLHIWRYINTNIQATFAAL
jgi:hypothetical protein